MTHIDAPSSPAKTVTRRLARRAQLPRLTTGVVSSDGSASPWLAALVGLLCLAVSLLACKQVAAFRANPESMCKRMAGWSDTPTALTAEKCQASLTSMQTDKPEVYECTRKCAPASASQAEMGSCMKGCAPPSAIATAPKKRAKFMISLSSPNGAHLDSGKCSVNLTLDGYLNRGGSGYCAYDRKAQTFSITFNLVQGQSLKLGGQAARFSGNTVTLSHPAGALIAEASAKNPAIEVPLELTDADGTWHGQLNLLSELLTARFKTIDTGPVLFPGEDGSGGGAASLLMVGGYTVMHHGKVGPLKELDLIAVEKTRSRSFSGCTYTKGSKRKTVRRAAYDKLVTVYERRSGKRLGSKTIKAATPSCPSSVKESEYVISKHVKSDLAFSFAKTFVR